MNGKENLWKYATVIAVAFLLINPELIALGLVIDSIGLDLFLLMLEIQFIAIGGFIFQTRIKPVLVLVNKVLMKLDPYFFIPDKNSIAIYPPILLHAIPGLVGIYWLLIVAV